MPLDITAEQYLAWKNGRMIIQEAFPHLTADEREFMITGMTPQDWHDTFPPEDEE